MHCVPRSWLPSLGTLGQTVLTASEQNGTWEPQAWSLPHCSPKELLGVAKESFLKWRVGSQD